MIWKSKKNKAKIDDARKSATDAAAQLKAQRSLVNSTSLWLANRKEVNGFGTDFEYTLRPRGSQ
jgi:hypothetical protein